MTNTYCLTLCCLFFFFVTINGQSPISNFGYHNPFYFNPAMTGIDKKRKLTLNFGLMQDERHGLTRKIFGQIIFRHSTMGTLLVPIFI